MSSRSRKAVTTRMNAPSSPGSCSGGEVGGVSFHRAADALDVRSISCASAPRTFLTDASMVSSRIEIAILHQPHWNGPAPLHASAGFVAPELKVIFHLPGPVRNRIADPEHGSAD
jgi:hypothetical protein